MRTGLIPDRHGHHPANVLEQPHLVAASRRLHLQYLAAKLLARALRCALWRERLALLRRLALIGMPIVIAVIPIVTIRIAIVVAAVAIVAVAILIVVAAIV